MKRALLVAELLAALILLPATWPRASLGGKWLLDTLSDREPAAIASFDATTIDLGRIKPNQRPAARFRVSNAGRKRLILSPKTGCRCSQKPLIVPPGSTEDLIVPLETSLQEGSLFRQFAYSTNDAACPEITFTVRAELLDDGKLMPIPDPSIR